MSTSRPTTVIIQCDDAPIPAAFCVSEAEIRQIRADGDDRDLDLQIQDLYQTVLTQVSHHHQDLVRLAAYVYRADLLVSRGGTRDSDGRRWKRHLSLCVPVSDPAYWQRPEVMTALSSVLAFLTDDTWRFAFSPARPLSRQIHLDLSVREVYQQPGVVTLFSGGIDSLCTLLEAAMRGERPIPVGHWPAPAHQHRQEQLLSAVNTLNASWSLPLIGVRIIRHGPEPANNAQRTRGFLFGCLGGAIAAEVGVSRVYLPDNGPISLNLPINDQLVGALASRVTHPQYLYRLNRLLQLVLTEPVTVSNPLRWRTRAETLEVLKQAHAVSLLPLTLSCSNWRGQPGAKPHCGGCSQCVDRRVATIAAGLEQWDLAHRYQQDLFLDPLEPWDRAATAMSYVRFARRVHAMTAPQVLTAFPELVDIAVPDDPAPDATLRNAIDLVDRHAATVLEVVERQTAIHLRAFIEGRLPAASLLAKTMSEQQGRRVPIPTPRPVAERVGVSRQLTPTRDDVPVSLGAADIPANVFAWTGASWQVSYGGTAGVLKPSVGLTRIACLLREPNRMFSPEELEAVANGRASSQPPGAGDRAEFHHELIASTEVILDQDTLRAVREHLDDLEADRLAAIDAGDGERAMHISESKEAIERYLRVNQRLGGGSRTIPTEAQKHYRAMRRSIERSLDGVKMQHHLLYRHLQQSLVLDKSFRYAPDRGIDWDVQLPLPSA